MEAWRFMVSLGILLVIWAAVVTLLGEPPTPGGIIVATLFASVGLYISDKFVQRLADNESAES